MADNMKEKYESLSLAVLRDVAKSRGIKGTSSHAERGRDPGDAGRRQRRKELQSQ